MYYDVIIFLHKLFRLSGKHTTLTKFFRLHSRYLFELSSKNYTLFFISLKRNELPFISFLYFKEGDGMKGN